MSALVALMGSRHERVRQLAVQELAELGPGVAGILRTVRRSPTPSRRGALAALRWHHTVPRSREALTRVAADHSLPPNLRELACDGLRELP